MPGVAGVPPGLQGPSGAPLRLETPLNSHAVPTEHKKSLWPQPRFLLCPETPRIFTGLHFGRGSRFLWYRSESRMIKSSEIWAMTGNSWVQMESMLGVRSQGEVRRVLATHGFKRARNRSGFSVGPCLRCSESQSVEFLNAKHICGGCESKLKKKPDPVLEEERTSFRRRMARTRGPNTHRWTREEVQAIADGKLRQVAPD